MPQPPVTTTSPPARRTDAVIWRINARDAIVELPAPPTAGRLAVDASPGRAEGRSVTSSSFLAQQAVQMRTATAATSAPEPPAARSARKGSVEGELFTATMPSLPPSPTMQAQTHARGSRADRSPTQVQLPARGASGGRGAARSRAAPELTSPPPRRVPEAAAAVAAQRAQQRQPPPILLFEGSPGEQPVQRQPPQWPSPPIIPQVSPGYAPHATPSSSSTLRRRHGASPPPALPPVLLPASHAYAAHGRPAGGAPEHPSQAAGAGGAPWEQQQPQQQPASADSQRLFDARAALLVAGLHVR